MNDEPPVFVFSEFREETTESRTAAGHVSCLSIICICV